MPKAECMTPTQAPPARKLMHGCYQVVLTGGKHEDHLNEALVKLLPILNQYKVPDG